MIPTRLPQHVQLNRLLIVSILVMSLLLVACGEPDPKLENPQPQGQADADKPTGEILFVAGNNVMLWDGDIEQITEDIHAASPTWAPVGDRFAYVDMYLDVGYSELMIADRDGDVLLQVTDNRPNAEPFSHEFARFAYWARDPMWSPVGEQLVWVSDKEGWEAPEGVERYSDPLFLWYSETWDAPPYLLNGSAEIGVTQEMPAFSPDGDTVAFVVRNEPTQGVRVPEIWLMDLNAATYDVLLSTEDGAYAPDWAPDGEHITYIQRTGKSNDVWIAPIDGGEPYQITEIGSAASPVWSPDGKFIVFFRENQGEFEAQYVELTETEDGQFTASEPEHLFSADNIDTVSGMSWIQR